MTDLTGRRVLVTGASKGIGFAVADAMAAAGADLVLSARGREELEKAGAELTERYGIRTAAIPADLAVGDEASRLAREAVAAFGGLDVLVNNAGVSITGPATDIAVEHWDAVMDVNLRGACLLASRVGALMAASGGGRIVNVSSTAGLRALRDHYAYCISKAGLLMATEVLAMELGPQGVRVNAVCPTVVMTEMGKRVWGADAKAAPMLARIPVGHFAEPHDVAAAVLYLASPESAMLNGVSLPVDGGYTVS